MNLYPDEMSAFGGGQGLFRLADDIGISISSEKPIVIVGRECVQFDTSLLVIEAPNGEIIIAKKHYPETEAVDSSFIICNRYDIWTKKYTHIEGWICIAFGSVNDSLEEVQKGWNWFGFGLAVIGIVAVVAVVSFVTLSGMGPFVLGCMAVGAVVGGIRGAKVAHEAGLTGSDFLAVVGLGALAGGLEGAFVGVGVSAAISLGAAFMANPLTFSLAGIFGLTTINFLPNILAATKNGLQTLLGFIPQWQIEETMAAIGKNPCVTMITQYGLAPEFFYAVGFEQDEDGIYHARLDAPQAAFGYNDFYDFAFGYGTDMSVQRIPFTCDGNDYALWAWKGDYLNLGAGAELGIYEQFGDSEHYIVNKEISLPMTLRLEDEKGNLIFSYEPEEKQWWITGFNPFTPSPNVQNLKAIYTVDFSGGNEKMYADVKEAFMDLEDTPDWAIKDWLPDDTNYTIQFEL